ncbi:MAG: DUF423 domain-containing protein [Alphaproteobacteria bacterium]|nr:DUF423 domain-containing protein [Alphaproteobacteria bacterium]
MFVFLGAIMGLAAVAMSAASAHMLVGRLDAVALGAVRNAVQMQGWHALALLFCGVWASRGGLMLLIAGWCFFVGLLLFAGGIYAHALAELRVPAIAPAGGTLLMLGWLFVALAAATRRR